MVTIKLTKEQAFALVNNLNMYSHHTLIKLKNYQTIRDEKIKLANDYPYLKITNKEIYAMDETIDNIDFIHKEINNVLQIIQAQYREQGL